MAVYLGVDFGTRNIEIYVKGKGIVLREPNVAAVDAYGNVTAVGTEALLIHGRAPGTVTLRRPYSGGAINDFNLTAELLDRFLEAAAPKVKKHIIASVKYSLDEGSRELLRKAFSDCRTGKIELVDSTVAALKGCGFDPGDSDNGYGGTVVCDIGADTVDVSYIRGGELLRSKSMPSGGNAQDSAMIAYIRNKYSLAVEESEILEAKHKLALSPHKPAGIEIFGLDTSTGMPRRIVADETDLTKLCAAHVKIVAQIIGDTLNNLPRHGDKQSHADRIILVGGGAKLPGIHEYLEAYLECNVTVATSPLDATVQGLGIMCEKM